MERQSQFGVGKDGGETSYPSKHSPVPEQLDKYNKQIGFRDDAIVAIQLMQPTSF